MRIFFSTGDTSGEQHVAGLVAALRRINPDMGCSALGSEILRQAGVEIALDSSAIKVMGFAAIVRHLPEIYSIFNKTLEYIGRTQPDAVVLVDYPGFNLRLARAVKKKFPRIPVIYYITPQVWAWRQSRVEIIRQCVDHCLCILPFEEKWFRQHQVSAEYVGSPVMDSVRNVDRRAARRMLELDDHTRLISIFPGSRRKEMEYIFKPMMQAVEILREDVPDLAFAVAAAPGFTRSDLEKYYPIPSTVPVLEGYNRELLAGSHFCLAKSGTTTLEAGLLGCPMLVAYRGDWLSARLAFLLMRLNKTRFISLPNIITNRSIVPEFLQEMCNGPELARICRLLLLDWELYDQMVADLRQLRDLVGEEPADERAAKALLRFLADPVKLL